MTAADQQLSLMETIHIPPSVRAVMRKPEDLTPTQWAEKYINLPAGKHAFAGPWRSELTPYMVKPLNTFPQPWVRQQVLCFSEQTGKSMAEQISALYGVERNPRPALVVMPDKDLAEEVISDRIGELIKASPKVRAMLAPGAWAIGLGHISFLNGASIRAAWARSAAALSSRNVGDVYLDEVDKFVKAANKESDPMRLAKVRTRTFPGAKIFIVSTPRFAHDNIWPALTKECQQIDRYFARCTICGHLQLLEFKHPDGSYGIVWPKEIRDPVEMLVGHHARYQCRDCGELWDDTMRDRAVRAKDPEARYKPYRWVEDEDGGGAFERIDPIDRCAYPGFFLPSWYSRFVSLSEVAASFLGALGNKPKAQEFVNSHECLPFRDWSAERTDRQILRLRDERQHGLVHPDTDVLLATVDVQEHGFWYRIRGWKFGPQANSWGVRHGYVAGKKVAGGVDLDFTALEEVLFQSAYVDPTGNQFPVSFGLMDSGYRKKEVYDWCLMHPPFMPSKGQGRPKGLRNASKITSHPGLFLHNFDANSYKDSLSGKLLIAPGDPGALMLEDEADEIYAAHMCAEIKDEDGNWINPGSRRNDLWDCEVMQLLAWDIIGGAYRARQDQQPKPKRQPPRKRRASKW